MTEQTLAYIIVFAIATHGILALFAAIKLGQHDILLPLHRILWLLFIWCIPVVGVVCLHITYRVAWGGHAAHNSGMGVGAGEGGGCDGGC